MIFFIVHFPFNLVNIQVISYTPGKSKHIVQKNSAAEYLRQNIILLSSSQIHKTKDNLIVIGLQLEILGHFINAAITDEDVALAVDIADDAFSVVAERHPELNLTK